MPRLRALGAFLAFVVVQELVGDGAGWLVFQKLALVEPKWQPSSFMVIEGIAFIAALVGALAAAAIQRRGLGAYGFALGGGLRHFLIGSAWGLGAVALLVGAIAALGGFTISGLNFPGTTLLGYAVAWLVAMILVGLAEESTFRAAGMFTLGDAIGIWPAALVTTLIFSALHYFQKPNENIADALSVGLLGLFMAFTIIRTRSI